MKKFDFKDINLIPKYSEAETRSVLDTSVELGGYKFKNPVIPSNMDSVIDKELAVKLARNGYFYIMHRFGVNPVEFTKYMYEMGCYSSISIGVNSDSYDQLNELIAEKISPAFITIDIAHGHCLKMKNMIKFINKNFDSFIIAGNIASEEAVGDLIKWGADAIKVGIGCGSPCTTTPKTGFGSRNAQAYFVNKCALISSVPVIADGGIKEYGDISKAIVMGADMVMVGGMLSSFEDSPCEIIMVDGVRKMEYHGSASEYQSGKNSYIEGTRILNDIKEGSVIDEMNRINQALQSAISYGGGTKISDLKYVRYVI